MTPQVVGFVLLSPARDPAPSTRISVLNMFPYLRKLGYDPQILYEPSQPSEQPDVAGVLDDAKRRGASAVYFQKVAGPSVLRLAAELRATGIKTVYGVCDLVDAAMADATDATIAVTDYLKRLYPACLQHKVHVVHDGIERPEVLKRQWRIDAGTAIRPLRALLVTSAALDDVPVLKSPPSWLSITIVGRYPASRRLDRINQIRWQWATRRPRRTLDFARFILNPRIRCIAWSPATMYREMANADIGIIPVDRTHDEPVPSWSVKSENRLTMKMAVGLPVVATPIPSYLPVVVDGKNGFFAECHSDWLAALTALRSADLRAKIGNMARASVLERYSMHEQANALADVLARIGCPGLRAAAA